MPTLLVTDRSGTQKPVAVEADETVMKAIRDNGFDELRALCGGFCSCATCHVYVDESAIGKLPPISEEENELLDGSNHRLTTSRLSCQIKLNSALDGLCVTIAPED